MSAVDIPWRRATRHHFNVGREAVEVAYSRGVALIAYRAAVGPLCMALNRIFIGETLVDAKEQAAAFAALGVDLLVSPNVQNRAHCSILKDTSGPHAGRIDLGKAAEATGVGQVFLHNARFIVVLDAQAADIDMDRLLRGVVVE